jgi:hypothetical protein
MNSAAVTGSELKEMLRMLFETRLRRLETRYRARLTAAGASQLREPGVAGEASATAQAIGRANAQSRALEQSMRERIEPKEPEHDPAERALESGRLEDTATA